MITTIKANTSLTISTNNVPRPLLRWEDLTEKEQESLRDEDLDRETTCAWFFRFLGEIYVYADAVPIRHEFIFRNLPEWKSYISNDFQSGLLIRPGRYEKTVVIGVYTYSELAVPWTEAE